MADVGPASAEDLLLIPKLAVLVAVGFITLIGSAIPWVAKRRIANAERFVLVISVLVSGAAGIVFGAYLCHIVPDSMGNITAYFVATLGPDSQYTNFPWSQALTGVVFIVLVTIEKSIVDKGITLGQAPAARGHAHHAHDEGHGHGLVTVDDVEAVLSAGLLSSSSVERSYGTPDNSAASQSEAKPDGFPSLTSPMALEKPMLHVHTAAGSAEAEHDDHRARVLRAYMFFLAMSIHALFDGLSVGSEANSAQFTALAFAVLAHKLFDGIAVGVPVFLAKFSRWHATAMIVIPACMTPLGIGVGVAVTDYTSGTQAMLAAGILQALSGGTFLYIAIFEMLPSALKENHQLGLKLTLFGCGFLFMAVIAFWV